MFEQTIQNFIILIQQMVFDKDVRYYTFLLDTPIHTDNFSFGYTNGNPGVGKLVLELGGI